MKKPNDTTCFFVRNGEFQPIAPNDRSISRWNVASQAYNYLSVLSVKVYDKDLQVADGYQVPRHSDEKKEKKKRGVIKKYSFGASKRCKFFMRNTGHLMKVIITLTYPNDYPMDGVTVKKHLHRFLLWLTYHGYKYIWVLEFQERGAPHFHILVDKEIHHQKVAECWYKIVGSKDEKHLKAGTEVRAIRAKGSIGYYLTTYMEKAKQKAVPVEYEKVGRFWGNSKNLLKENKMKIYGSRDDITQLKDSLKVARHFDRAQKRAWERKARAKGKKKNKFKKFYNNYLSYSLRVTNSDKLIAELAKRNMTLFPYELLGILPVPPIPLSVEWRGGLTESRKDEVRTQKLGLEDDEDELRRMGLY